VKKFALSFAKNFAIITIIMGCTALVLAVLVGLALIHPAAAPVVVALVGAGILTWQDMDS